MKRIWFLITLFLCGVLLLTGCMGITSDDPPESGGTETMMVDVMLQENEGIVITGQNPIEVEAGQDATFAVEIRDGYKLVELGQGATYENGVITVPAVRFPTTVKVNTRTLHDLEFYVENETKYGSVSSNVAGGIVKEDTMITLRVTPKEGMLFLGYSVGGTREKGGTIIATSSEYTFPLTESLNIYTNFYNVGSGRLVIYDSNGGKEGLQYYVFSDDSPYIGPNTLANKGQFTREGYVLTGYNTKPDGSGTYYGTGWSLIIPEDKKVATTLYAQWMPVTEKEAFANKVSNKTVTITGYKGTHETVVVPETIDGMPVVAIAANAFINEKFTTLYLSKNLKTIEDQAFLGCKSLKTLYFCDTPSSMTDNAFKNCFELQKLYMLSCMDPRYSTSNNGTYKMKYQRLITAEGKKIIFHGGSNVSYGIDISTIQDKLGGEYAGVNFGCNWGTPAVFFAEVAAEHMNPGDILVMCPEVNSYQYGRNDINTTTWQIFEGAYNAFADVDIRRFTAVFKSFAAFNTNRYKSTAKTYEQYNKQGNAPGVSKYGEFNINHNGQTSALKKNIAEFEAKGGYGSTSLDVSLLSQDYNANMNKAIDLVISKGGKVYYSFAAHMRLHLNRESQTAAAQKKYTDAVAKAFPKATVISSQSTYVLEKDLFYNSAYHLSSTGSVYRAELLAADILVQFAKEKK